MIDSFPVIVALVGIGGALFALSIKKASPERYAALGRIFAD